MILSPWYRLKRQADAVGAGVIAAPVATITHTHNGTFSIIFRGTNGAVIYCDPGDGSAVQEKTLLGLSTNVTFSYANDGTERTVRITGALDQILWLTAVEQYIIGHFSDIFNGMSRLQRVVVPGNAVGTSQDIKGDISVFADRPVKYFAPYYNPSIVGDVTSILSAWNGVTYSSLGEGTHTCSLGSWVCTSITTNGLTSCFSSADDVGNALINSAGVQTSGALYLAGTNPAPPSTPEVTAAIAELLGDGVSLFLN